MLFQVGKAALALSVLLMMCFTSGCTRGDVRPDTMPPTVPNGLSITAVSPSEVKISWKPSTDDRGVKGYRIYRNGAFVKKTDATSMTDGGLKPQVTYCYKVSAYDGSGKESAQSTDVCAIL